MAFTSSFLTGKRGPALLLPVLLVALGGFAAGCDAPLPQGDYVARLGSEMLTQEALADALEGLALEADSADAARQIIEQWVTNRLLWDAAIRSGLPRDPAVQDDLLEAERAILGGAFVQQQFEESGAGPSEAELQAFFERQRERLRLVEPYVRVRYLQLDSLDTAREARARLAAMDTSAHAEWNQLIDEVSLDPELSRSLAGSFFPRSRAFPSYPQLNAAVTSLSSGQTTQVLPTGGRYHVLQLTESVPAGTLPERAWIEPALRQQLEIESRKLLYVRLVQSLRNEALAEQRLEVRN